MELAELRDETIHILTRYSNLLEFLTNFDNKKACLENEEKLHIMKVDQLKTMIQSVKDNFEAQRQTILNSALEVERQKIRASYQAQLNTATAEITKLAVDRAAELSSVKLSVQRKYGEELKTVEDMFEVISSNLNYDTHHVKGSCVNTRATSLAQAKKLFRKFEQANSAEQFAIPISEKICNRISISEITSGIPPKMALVVTTFILLAAELSVLFLSYIVFCILGIITVFSTKTLVSNKRNQVNFDIAYWKAHYGLINYKEIIQQKIQTEIDTESAKINTQFDEKLTVAEANKNYIQEECDNKVEGASILLDSEEFKQNALQSQLQSIENIINQYNEANEILNKHRDDYTEFLNSKTDLIELKDALQEQITSEYITNMHPGKQVTLSDQLLLGFNDDDTLITIANMCSSNIILFDGNVSDCYDLVTLIVTQIFNIYNITILDIAVVDISSTLVQFQVFASKQLEDVFQCITTADGASEKIKTLYEDIPAKMRQISRRASDIREFNQLMFDTNSLPQTLSFPIMLDAGDKIFDDKFIKICADAETIGMFPIVFLDKKKINDSLSNANSNDKTYFEGLLKLSEAVKHWYEYIPAGGIFSTVSDYTRADYIARIKTKLNM